MYGHRHRGFSPPSGVAIIVHLSHLASRSNEPQFARYFYFDVIAKCLTQPSATLPVFNPYISSVNLLMRDLTSTATRPWRQQTWLPSLERS